MTSKPSSFFSISFDLIVLNIVLKYDLYINSSTLESREKFIRVYPKGAVLTHEDMNRFRNKYHRLYVSEDQRNDYLKSLMKSSGVTPEQKGHLIKNTAIHYLGKIFDKDKSFTTEMLEETIKGCKDVVENMVDFIKEQSIDHLRDLIANLSFHDFYTYDHSINVSMYCISFYQYMHPDATHSEITHAGLGGLLHDIGKIKIPTNVINKPGNLTDEEFKLIKMHPNFGKELVQSFDKSDNSFNDVDFNILKRVIMEHHENINGTGYPKRLKGEDIHYLAKITAIVDFFDAITTKRSYHESLSTDEALSVMSKAKGRKIDSDLFDKFVKHCKSFVKTDLIKAKLPDNFDPCQPHAELPFEKIEKEKQFDSSQIIKLNDDLKNKNVKVKIINDKNNQDIIKSDDISVEDFKKINKEKAMKVKENNFKKYKNLKKNYAVKVEKAKKMKKIDDALQDEYIKKSKKKAS
jgi:HD-GYP domain-containing protein (c-di-GMP phosphodiesterase class II)